MRIEQSEQFDLLRQHFNAAKVEVNCLCGSAEGFRTGARDRYGLEIVPFFCSNCGHIYAKYRFTDADLANFYAQEYRRLYGGESGLKTPAAANSRIKASRRTIFSAFQASFSDWPNRVVVEWGCGAGWNLVPFRESNVQCCGFDFDTEYIPYGRTEFGLDLRIIDALTEPSAAYGKKADFLILNHVLEHATEPLSVLDRVAEILQPNGVIYVGLPFLENLPQWGFKDFFHIAHLHYFSVPYFVAYAGTRGWTAQAINRKDGYVVLRRGAPVVGVPQLRLHNAYLMAKYAFIYRTLYPPWRYFVEAVKKVPGIESSYMRLMKALGKSA